jgi:formate hydrogenlyase subunit 3/multisubunit Na+/H+ antiporter MnhD subunit
VLFFLRRWHRLTVIIGTTISLTLALIARLVPINELLVIGPWRIKINDTLTVLGRQFVLSNSDRPLLVILYLLAGIWFAAAYVARAGRAMVPLSIVIMGMLVSVPAVNPFLYAALLLEIAVLICVVLLNPPGNPVPRGVLRFLTFQTLGMPFILFTGWILTGVEANPGESELISRASILLGFGFALWLAIFPFHTWLPMLGEKAHPYVTGFLFFMLPFVIQLFGLGFLERYAWLRDMNQLYTLLRTAGIIMMLTGGLWAAFQDHLGRLLGYAIMVEIGKALVSISLPGGLSLFFAMLLPRAITLAVWCLAMASIKSSQESTRVNNSLPDLDLNFSKLRGLAYRMPLVSISLVVGYLSIAGMPLMAGFPGLLALIQTMAVTSPLTSMLTILGTAGLFVGGTRILMILVQAPDPDPGKWRFEERGAVIFYLSAGILVLFTIGLFPQVVLPSMASLAQIFPRLMTAP